MSDAPEETASSVLTRMGILLAMERSQQDILCETVCGENAIRLLRPTERNSIGRIEVESGKTRRQAHLVVNEELLLVARDDAGIEIGRGSLIATSNREHPCDDCPGQRTLPVLGKTKFCLFLTATCQSTGGTTCCDGDIGACVSSFKLDIVDFSLCWTS